MDAVDHGKRVLGAIFASRSRSLLDFTLRHLRPTHFTDPLQVNLFIMAERYRDAAGGVLTRAALDDSLRDKPPGTVQQYGEYWDMLLAAAPSTPEEVRWSVVQLKELAAERLTGDALTTSMEILTRGVEEGRTHFKGHADARNWLLGRMGSIDQELHQADAPEGDTRTEAATILKEYAHNQSLRAAGVPTGVGLGIPEVDDVLGGAKRGQFILVAGFQSAGKSSLCVQWAWNAAIEQGKNVVVFTTETLRGAWRTKVLARHSRLERFGLELGLNTTDIEGGTLKVRPACAGSCTFGCDLCALRTVVADYTSPDRPGRLYVAQLPSGATMSTVSARTRSISSLWTADLVVIDYARLLRPERGRREAGLREDLAGIIVDGKEFAATYNNGQGVPVISPWQINREGEKAAKAAGSGSYELFDLSDTNESGATADVVLTLRAKDGQDTRRGRDVPLTLSVPKNRGGERNRSFDLRADFATCRFTAEDGAGNSFDPLAGLDTGFEFSEEPAL